MRVCSPYNGEYSQSHDFTSVFVDEDTPVILTHSLENSDDRHDDPEPNYPFYLLDDPDYDTGI